MNSFEEIENWFSYHPPKNDQVERYAAMRNKGKQLAEFILLNTPPGNEQDQAIDNIRQAVMWANAAIACGE